MSYFDKYDFSLLIIDDDQASSYLLEAGIGQHFRNTFIATCGEKALEILSRENDIGFVLLDICMPDMNGFEVLSKIHLLKPDLPAIAVTACIYDGLDKELMDSGFCDYINKPVRVKKLLSKIVKFSHVNQCKFQAHWTAERG